MKRSDIDIRQPLATRVVCAVVGGGFAIFAVVAFAWAGIHGESVGGAPIAAGMAVVSAGIGYRVSRLSLRSGNQELIVRNFWRTHHKLEDWLLELTGWLTAGVASGGADVGGARDPAR
jgi:hypothetical protein